MKKEPTHEQNTLYKFPKILDAMLEGVQIMDFEWRYIYVNAAAAKHGKTSKEELLGNRLMDLYPNVEGTALFDVLSNCMLGRVSQSFENEFEYPDRSKRWFELSIQPVEQGIFILSIDITARKEAEERLNKANHLYAFISQVNKNIVRVKDEQTLFRNACRMAYEFGKFKMAWIGLFSENDTVINLVEQFAMPEEAIPLFHYGVCQLDGPQIYVLRTNNYFVSNDVQTEKNVNLTRWLPFAHKYDLRSCFLLPIRRHKKIIGTLNLYSSESNFLGEEEILLLVEVAKDISFALDKFEEKRQKAEAEQRLLMNERRYRALIEKSSDIITLSDAKGKITYASPSASKIFGYTLEEFQQLTASIFIHPDSLQEFIDKRKSIEHIKGASFYMEVQLKSKDDRWIWCETTMTNMLEEPSIQAFVGNFRDISERKITEQKLELQNETLTKTNAELDRFVYSASHELRAPLTSVMGLVSLIEMNTQDAAILEYANMIRTSINRLDEFTKNILGYSRNNRTELSIEKIAVRNVVSDVVDLFRNMKNAEHIAFSLDIDEQQPFYSDPKRFNTIIENLVSNAIKYQKKGNPDAFINIRIRVNPQSLYLFVEDNGIGIPTHYRTKIFDMFFRISGKIPGAGIGLYIVRETLDVIKGSIQVHSQEGVGTAFLLTIKNWLPD